MLDSEVGEFPQPTLVAQENITYCVMGNNPTCTGSINLEIPDGATIEWLNAPNSNHTNSSSLNNLCPGVYQANVTKDGCGFVHSYEIICCTIVEGSSLLDTSLFSMIILPQQLKSCFNK